MPFKPIDDIEWATGGTADVVEPLTAQKQDGWDAGDKPPAQWFNWIQRAYWRWIAWLTAVSLDMYGDGSAGDLTASSGTTTLTGPTYYNDVTLSGTAKISCDGWPLFINGTLDLTNAGANAISATASTRAGSNANVGTGGAGGTGILNGKWVGAGTDGGTGGNNGANPGGDAQRVDAFDDDIQFANGGVGGEGGLTDAAAAGAGGDPENGRVSVRVPLQLFYCGGERIWGGTGGGGGAGGGGGTGGAGGGGGGGNGVLEIWAAELVIASSAAAGCISAIGGVGGNASDNSNNAFSGGGGGGGGGGGVVRLRVGKLTGSKTGAIVATGGAGGNGGSTAAGGAGSGGKGGVGGAGGQIITDIEGVIAVTTGSAGSAASVPSGDAGTAGGAGGACTADIA